MSLPSLQDLANLGGALDQVSEAKFQEVAKLLEEVRDQPEVQAILHRMRERLRRIRPQRKPTLQRLFYRPFEDLLVNEPTGIDDGRVTRLSASLAWNYVQNHMGENERKILATMETRLRQAAPDDRQAQAVMANRLWPMAATFLEDALVAAGTNKAIRNDMVGKAVEHLDEIRQIVRMLQVAEEIQLLKDTLPIRPIRGLMNSQLALIRQTVALGHQGRPERAYAIMLSILARMSLPAEFMRRTLHLKFDLSDMGKVTLYARLGRTVLADLEAQARAIASSASDDLPTRVDQTHRLIDELEAAGKVLRDSDPDTRARLARLREIAEETVSAVINAAWQQVTHAIKIGPAAPVENLMRTESSLLALRKCAVFADDVGLATTVREMLDAVMNDLMDKVRRQFIRLSTPDHPQRNEPGMEREMYWSIRMIELAGRAQEAEQIRQDFMRYLPKG